MCFQFAAFRFIGLDGVLILRNDFYSWPNLIWRKTKDFFSRAERFYMEFFVFVNSDPIGNKLGGLIFSLISFRFRKKDFCVQ